MQRKHRILCGTSCRVYIQYCETLSKKDCQLGIVPKPKQMPGWWQNIVVQETKFMSLPSFFLSIRDDDDEWWGENRDSEGDKERENIHITTRWIWLMRWEVIKD